MNERIKEIARESGLLVHNPNKVPTKLEKFAELIVRDCLAQADALRDALESDGEDQQALGADWVGLAIARHFGVE